MAKVPAGLLKGMIERETLKEKMQPGGMDFYAEVPVLAELLPSIEGVENAVVIFRARGREHGASTGLKWLMRYTTESHGSGNLLMLTDLEQSFVDELEKTGLLELIGKENVFLAQPDEGAALDEALKTAGRWLADRKSGPADTDAGDAEA